MRIHLVDSHFTAYDREGTPILITTNEICVHERVSSRFRIEVDNLEFWVPASTIENHTHPKS